MIRFDGVTKVYAPGAVAVDDLSLVASTGQVTVLVGPSGCGKTTSLRMVNRMITPTRGSIFLDDVDTASLPATELRRGIGYVIQHGGLFPHLTIERNVMTVPRLSGWSTQRARKRARELLELVGLSADLAGRYPSQLSGGQQQRVGVARALAADPPVLLMDEPFSAIDPVVRDQLQGELIAVQRELRKTILFVTHDIDEALRLGDQIAVLRVGGRLAQLDPPARLLREPADGFVADFLGRDRGYRSLGFRGAQEVPVRAEEPVRLGEAPAGDRAGWRLVVDDAGRPKGWLDGWAGGPVGPQDVHLGGTLAQAGGSLRSHLDAALSSPSGRGVVVDDDGVLVGVVHVDDVFAAIEDTEDSPRAGRTPDGRRADAP